MVDDWIETVALPARRVAVHEDAPRWCATECYGRLRRARRARARLLALGAKAARDDGSKPSSRCPGDCAAAQLRFGEPCVDAPRHPPGAGSELLYYNTNLDALVATIADQLSEDGVCVLCVVHRIYGGAAALMKSAASHGLLAFDMPANDDADVVDASRLHVLCRAGRVESLFDSAPLLIPVVSDSDDDDDEAAFLKAASGALDE